MSNWFDRVRTAVDAAGAPAIVWPAGEGRLLLSPTGARLLAADIPGLDGNVFWHHPDMEDTAKASAALRGAGGGIGGDRLWIAPEIAYIFNPLAKARIDPITFGSLPPAMDPADWQVMTDTHGYCAMQADMTLTDHRLGKQVALRATREVWLADRPANLPDGLQHLGFGIRNTLARMKFSPGTVAGAWDLLQLPPTGTLICPTTAPGIRVRSYYEPFGDRHVRVEDNCVRFLIDGKHRIKMGFLAEYSTGRMGYYRPLDGRSVLIVRIFLPQPGRPYCDLPRSSDDLLGGDAVQAYNDDGTFGGFGEMEYHDPALLGDGPLSSTTGESITHVLVGPDEVVCRAGRKLLGVRLEMA